MKQKWLAVLLAAALLVSAALPAFAEGRFDFFNFFNSDEVTISKRVYWPVPRCKWDWYNNISLSLISWGEKYNMEYELFGYVAYHKHAADQANTDSDEINYD